MCVCVGKGIFQEMFLSLYSSGPTKWTCISDHLAWWQLPLADEPCHQTVAPLHMPGKYSITELNFWPSMFSISPLTSGWPFPRLPLFTPSSHSRLQSAGITATHHFISGQVLFLHHFFPEVARSTDKGEQRHRGHGCEERDRKGEVKDSWGWGGVWGDNDMQRWSWRQCRQANPTGRPWLLSKPHLPDIHSHPKEYFVLLCLVEFLFFLFLGEMFTGGYKTHTICSATACMLSFLVCGAGSQTRKRDLINVLP